MGEEDRNLTTEEAARLLGVQPRTVRDYIRTGRLRSLIVRIGFRKQHLIRESEVLRVKREAESR